MGLPMGVPLKLTFEIYDIFQQANGSNGCYFPNFFLISVCAIR